MEAIFFNNVDKKQKSTKEIKIEKVQKLTEKIAKSKTIAFANYRGLTVNQINTLRNKIKEAGGELLVEKNSLLKRALANQKLTGAENQLTGPTAVILAYEDEIAPIKETAQNAKTVGLPSFKFGFLGHELLDIQAIEDLAKIPSLSVLHGKIVSTIYSPIYGIVSVLQANIRNLIYALDQIAKQND